MANKNFIPEEDYKKILKQVPIVCVDLIVVTDNKFLLGKRTNEPAKGQWFVPGGRIYKGESLIDAVKRKAKEELGLEVENENIKFTIVGETIFKKGEDRHSVNIAYKIILEDKRKISFDKTQTSEIKWFSDIDENWHPYLKKILKTAGF